MDLFNLGAKITLDTGDYESKIELAKKAFEGLKTTVSGINKVGEATAKAVGTASGAIASGVGAMAKQAIDAYANYEQLIGGVDTLFKNAASTVQENASNAFKTAGLSANEYMETVTSFSASLLQALGGDTAEAAKKADMAITDMADNANKMGTSMEMIQNAYQGFAKQNYTMLDNLKLGYGGTKAEMERLLADASALQSANLGTEIKFDISSYADVIDAIHVIQTNMGITGTTAAEASETISGSFAALQASWANMLTGFATDELPLDSLINDVIANVGTLADNVVPRAQAVFTNLQSLITENAGMIGNLAGEMAAMVAEAAPQMVETASMLITSFVDAVSDNVTGISAAASSIIGALSEGIFNLMPEIGNIVSGIAGAFAEGFITYKTVIFTAGINVIAALVEGIANNIESVMSTGQTLLNGITESISRNIHTFVNGAVIIIDALSGFISENAMLLINTGGDILSNIISGISEALPDVIHAAISIIGALGTGIAENVGMILDLAMQLIGGIVNGIGQGLPEIIRTAPQVIITFINGLVEKLPEVFAMAGTIITELLAGIIKNLPEIITGSANIIAALVEGILKSLWMLGDAAVQLAAKIVEKLSSADWGQIGRDIVDGLKNGLAGAWNRLTDWFSEKWNGLVGGVKDLLGINSPSKVFASIGGFIDAGLLQGLSDGWGAVERLAGEQAGKLVDMFSVSPELSFAGFDYGYNQADIVKYDGADNERRGVTIQNLNVYAAEMSPAQVMQETAYQLEQQLLLSH